MHKIKSLTIVFALVLFILGCKNSNDKNNLEEVNTASVDTILTEFEESESNVAGEEVGDEKSIHDVYIPKIDSIISLFGELEDKGSWLETGNFQNLAIAESTEGNELLFYKSQDYTKYRLNTFGEMGKMEETFYLIKNEIFLYTHTEIRYNAPIGLDSADLLEDVEKFDPNKSELLIEDSYFRNNKIVYQACQDCGGTSATEYLKSIEEDVKAKITAFKKLAK
jgi:hypothetical protein